MGFRDGSVVKTLPANAVHMGSFLGEEYPMEKEMATHSSSFAWRIPWTEEPGGWLSMGSQRVRHDWATELNWTDWFCHTLTWIHHECTCVPHPEPLSQLPPHTIPLGHPSAPALSTLYHASNLDWWFVSHMRFYMFQCHSPTSSHPHPLPQSPEDCSIHLCLFCCLAYRVIVAFFLNSIYMH